MVKLMPRLDTKTSQLQRLAQVRGEVYRFCLHALDKPSHFQFDWLKSSQFQATLRSLCETFEVPLNCRVSVPDDYSQYESLYIACFDVGLPTPPVPLLASHYNRREPVPATIHEHVLFYKRFGVQVAKANIEPADHLCNELAFLIRLDDFLQEGTIEPDSLNQARYDFLTRHPSRWLPKALQTAQEKELPDLYIVLLHLLTKAIAQDVELVQAELSHEHIPTI